jgi:hypothetical protein
MQQLHALRSSDILLLADTCMFACVQIQTVGHMHWLHPRAIMVATLYDSLVICPGMPKRLRACLEFQKSLIRYVDPNPPECYKQKLPATSSKIASMQAVNDAVSTRLQKDETLDSIPCRAAAVQLHDERPACKTTEVTCLVHPASLTLLPLIRLNFMSPSLYACNICPLLGAGQP